VFLGPFFFQGSAGRFTISLPDFSQRWESVQHASLGVQSFFLSQSPFSLFPNPFAKSVFFSSDSFCAPTSDVDGPFLLSELIRLPLFFFRIPFSVLLFS